MVETLNEKGLKRRPRQRWADERMDDLMKCIYDREITMKDIVDRGGWVIVVEAAKALRGRARLRREAKRDIATDPCI